MAIVASDVINEARDFSPAFHPTRIGPTMALRMLSRAERSLFRVVTAQKQEALAGDETIDVADIATALDADPQTAVAIDAHFAVLGCKARDTDGKDVPVSLIPFSKRLNPGIFPSAYITNNEFHPIDLRQFDYATSGWEPYNSVTLTRVPVPPILTSLIDGDSNPVVLIAPDSAFDALVAQLILSMAQRLNVATSDMVDMAATTFQSAVMTIAHGDHSGSWHVLDSR